MNEYMVALSNDKSFIVIAEDYFLEQDGDIVFFTKKETVAYFKSNAWLYFISHKEGV